MKKSGKKQERELIEKTASIYQTITRDSMDGFWIIDMQDRFLDVNDAYCNLIGYSRRELLRMKISDVEVGHQPKGIVKHIKQIKKTGESRFLTRQRKKDGQIIDIEASANYADYLGGLIFVFLRDTSRHNKADAKLDRDIAKSKKATEQELADSYEHSKDQDKSIKVVEKQLADSYEHSKDQAKSIKVFEKQLADSYKHSKNEAESNKETETQLADSYKHLGLINRKISLLLELGKFPKTKKYRQEIIDHILRLAMNISKAPTGYLYSSKEKGIFNLLSHKGVEDAQKEKIKVITANNVGLLRHLIKERGLISGDIKRYEAELLALDNKLEHFVTLSLSKGTDLDGFIFLGFDKKKSVDTQDLEFLDVFAMHASNALAKAGVLK